MASEENSQPSTYVSNDDGHHPENLEPHLLNHGDAETQSKVNEAEVVGIMEVIAATGKFWHDWDTLKSLLSFRLKQVLSEYPEAQMTREQQVSSLGEAYSDLVQRLDEELHSFIEGPPFTLQRLCEILLSARNIYPNISKLALALEKNLLVTTTIAISTDPYPSTVRHGLEEPEKETSTAMAHSEANGVENKRDDEDEEMPDAEEVDEDNKNENIMETSEEKNIMETSEEKNITETSEEKNIMEIEEEKDIMEMGEEKNIVETPEEKDIMETAEEKNIIETVEEKNIMATPEEKNTLETAEEKNMVESNAEEKNIIETAEEKNIIETAEEKNIVETVEERNISEATAGASHGTSESSSSDPITSSEPTEPTEPPSNDSSLLGELKQEQHQ